MLSVDLAVLIMECQSGQSGLGCVGHTLGARLQNRWSGVSGTIRVFGEPLVVIPSLGLVNRTGI